MHQKDEDVCTCSLRVPRSGRGWAQPPSLRSWAALPRGCQPGRCQNSASGCNKGGELSLVGIFPCRAVNSVTGSEVRLPPCPAAVPRRPQLDPGGAAAPWLIPGSRQAAPALLPARGGGGLPFLPAGLSELCHPKRVTSAGGAIYSQEGRVCRERPRRGTGALRRLGRAAPTAVPKGRMRKQVAGDEASRIWPRKLSAPREASKCTHWGWRQPRLGQSPPGSHQRPAPSGRTCPRSLGATTAGESPGRAGRGAGPC